MDNIWKPVVLVDQDGPLADFDRRAFEVCQQNDWTTSCTLEEQTARYMTDNVIDGAHRRLLREHINDTAFFRDLPVTDGAVDGINRLAEVANVWIVTKPLEVNKTCRDDKAAWLADHFGRKWVDRLIIAPDKSLVRGHLLLDDAPKLEWIPRATWVPVIFPFNWNGEGSDWEGLPRWSWQDSLDDLIVETGLSSFLGAQL